MEAGMRDPIKEQATIFQALADPTRLRLLKLLCDQRDPDALCVNALAGLLGTSQPAVSQHLRVLKSVGLVRGDRRGYHVHYSVDPEVLKHYQQMIAGTLSVGKQEEADPCRACEAKAGGPE